MKYGSVIFDLDGVLLDSTGSQEWKFRAAGEALSELGADHEPDEKMLESVIGIHGYEACVKACGDIGVDPRRAWNLVAEKTSEARIKEIQRNHFGLVDGSVEVLDELRENQVKLGLISNAPDQAVEMVVDHYDLRNYFKFFRGVQSFEDLKANKPHPNHLELAKFQLKRDPFIYVGDHESDVEAARNAEMDSIWIHPENDDKPDFTVERLDGLERILSE